MPTPICIEVYNELIAEYDKANRALLDALKVYSKAEIGTAEMELAISMLEVRKGQRDAVDRVITEMLDRAEDVASLRVGSRVEAGFGDDHDTGVILSIDGDVATVAWDQGIRTPIELAELRAEVA